MSRLLINEYLGEIDRLRVTARVADLLARVTRVSVEIVAAMRAAPPPDGSG